MVLNTGWEVGVNRRYDREESIPGLPFPGNRAADGPVWYRKKLRLPEGSWNRATLLLRGAKFRPAVYINGEQVSSAEGGLAPSFHLLSHPAVVPGAEIELEIRLDSLSDVPDTDASKITPGDVWRSCLASHIWDDIELLTHRAVRIDNAVTEYNSADNSVTVYYRATLFAPGQKIRFRVQDETKILGEWEGEAGEAGQSVLRLSETPVCWSPEVPKLYTLVGEGDGWRSEQKIGLRNFEIRGKHFFLNDSPITLRMGTVVWHRWLRDDDSHTAAFDTEWFKKHIAEPLKKRGANAIRFHLGAPPKRFLDVCDELGLAVQTEWSFFHRMPASEESLTAQWKSWFADALAHPSVCILHPWNELDREEEIETALRCIDKVAPMFPPAVISHRDVTHIHAYWWSIFENLGLYYDGPGDFEKPVIADEFGGNYLGYDGEEGSYPTVRGTMERFLGPDRTKEDRVWLHTMSNGKVAEYWRRIGVAGFSPFCILSSREDGNTHFFGSVENPIEMPVWEALRCAYAPVSVSLNTWDRNFEPGQEREFEVYIFNDTGEERKVEVCCGVDAFSYVFTETLPPNARKKRNVRYVFPEKAGEYRMYAACGEVRSEWDVFVKEIRVPHLQGKIAVLPEETELTEFLRECNIPYTNCISEGTALLGMHKTYERLKDDSMLRKEAETLLAEGKPWHIFGAGPESEGRRHNGIGKNTMRFEIGRELERFPLPEDVTAVFYKSMEGESHVQPVHTSAPIWQGIDKKQMWLWNGKRGGLMVPAAEMEIEGTDAEGFLHKWEKLGAEVEAIKKGPYFALSSIGMHVFSETVTEEDKTALQAKVDFLLSDAPALKNNMEDYTVKVTDLHAEYQKRIRSAVKCEHLLSAGTGLGKVPAIRIMPGAGYGDVYLWQLCTDGRLMGKETDTYGKRRDSAACQLILNCIAQTETI